MTIRHNQIVVFKSLINMQSSGLNFKGEIEKRYFSMLQLPIFLTNLSVQSRNKLVVHLYIQVLTLDMKA